MALASYALASGHFPNYQPEELHNHPRDRGHCHCEPSADRVPGIMAHLLPQWPVRAQKTRWKSMNINEHHLFLLMTRFSSSRKRAPVISNNFAGNCNGLILLVNLLMLRHSETCEASCPEVLGMRVADLTIWCSKIADLYRFHKF